MNLKKEIQNLRKKNNLSQESFAEILGVSRQSVTKWENGDSLPEIEKLIIISEKFNINLDTLIKGQKNCSHHSSGIRVIDDSILDFLCKAKKSTYAGKGAETNSSRLGSHDLEFSEGSLKYLDSYFGGEKFSGEEVLWVDENPLWAMNYQGRVIEEGFSGDFLKECLLLVTPRNPYRGPRLYSSGDYVYHNSFSGSFEWFKGSEEIYFREQKVYECLYHGGLIK